MKTVEICAQELLRLQNTAAKLDGLTDEIIDDLICAAEYCIWFNDESSESCDETLKKYSENLENCVKFLRELK